MLALVRRHEVFHSLTAWLVSAGLTTSLVLAVWGLQLYRSGGGGSAMEPLLLAVWAALALFLVFGKVRSRCSRLDLALPVPARDLWLAHVIASILSSLALAAFAFALVGLHFWLLARSPRFEVPGLDLVALAAILFVGVVSAVVVIESLDLERYRVEVSWSDALWRFTVVAVVLAFSLFCTDHTLVFLLVPVGVALAVGLRSWQTMPAAFALVRREPLPSPRTRRGVAEEDGWAASGVELSRGGLLNHLFLVVHGARFGRVTPWISFSMVVLMGSVAAGVLSIWVPLEEFRYLYIPLYAFVLFTPVPAGMEQLAHLDPLPVSRRTLFAVLVLPSLAFFLIGYGATWLGMQLAAPDRELVEYRAGRRDPHFFLSVPVGWEEISWSGEVPQTTAPWGESRPAWSAPLLVGSPVALYSRFHTPEGSSMEFVAWQISRAAEAVYGVRIPAEEIRERYLEAQGDEVVLKTETLSLVGDFPGLEPLPAGPIFPFMLLTTVVLWLFAVAANARGYRAGVSSRGRTLRWMWFLPIVLGFILAMFALAVTDIMEPWALTALIEIPFRDLAGEVGKTVGFWLFTLFLLFFSYRLAERSFVGAELPQKPSLPKLT